MPSAIVMGQPYAPGVTRWPENVEYNYRSGMHELRLFLPGLSNAEVRAIRQGKARFGLLVAQPVILFLSEFFNPANPRELVMGYDSPYDWWRVNEEERTPPEDPEGTHLLLSLILVDGDTGIVRGLRACTFSPEFSTALYQAIAAQTRARTNQAEFDRTLAGLLRYPHETLMQQAIKTWAGD